MTTPSLIWSNIAHRRVRSLLTILSIALAFAILGVAQGVNSTVRHTLNTQHLDRLIVTSKASSLWTLPISFLDQIKAIPGVKLVSYEASFFGYYQRRENTLAANVVDPTLFLQSFDEFHVDPKALDLIAAQPSTVLIGRHLAERFNWKVGDRVPVQSFVWKNQDGSNNWEFQVAGIFDRKASEGSERMLSSMLINYKYVDEVRPPSDRGQVGSFIVNISDPAMANKISQEIDDKFRNSSAETSTQTEREIAQAQLRNIGDIGAITNAITGAVLFALIFVIGTSVSQSIRERLYDFAVMKSLGFQAYSLAIFIFLEVFALCAVGAFLGLVISTFVFPYMSLFGAQQIPLDVFLEAISITIVLAAICAMPSSVQVARLSFVALMAKS